MTDRLRALAYDNAMLYSLLQLKDRSHMPLEEWYIYAIETLVVNNNALLRQVIDTAMHAAPRKVL